MALPFVFAGMAPGNIPAADLDSNYQAVGSIGLIQCTASGTNTITLTPLANQVTISAYTAGQYFAFKAAATNSGAVTVNINAVGAQNLVHTNGAALVSGDLISGGYYQITYDGTNFQLGGALGNVPTPANPGDNSKILTANAGAYSWQALSGTGFLATAGGSMTGTIKFAKGANIAGASTTNVFGSTDNNFVEITGSAATITSFGTASQAGDIRTVMFTATGNVITNNAVIICPGGANITAHAGDIFILVAETTTVIRVAGYALASGMALVGGASGTPIVTVKKQTFTATGTYTPSTGMAYCYVKMVGGGAGGGGCKSSSAAQAASGGGGSGTPSEALLTAAQIGASKAATIGAAGAAGSAAGGDGGNGGTTSLGSLCTAPGGSGANNGFNGGGAGGNSFTPGGNGGAAGTSDIASTGAPGLPGMSIGAGGGWCQAGAGGSTPYGGGGNLTNAVVGGVNSNGVAGTGFGAGGSGATVQNTTGQSGGAGTKGAIWILEFCTS